MVQHYPKGRQASEAIKMFLEEADKRTIQVTFFERNILTYCYMYSPLKTKPAFLVF